MKTRLTILFKSHSQSQMTNSSQWRRAALKEKGAKSEEEGEMMQRLGDKSCSDQVSPVPLHLSLFLGVINQSQTGAIDLPLAALCMFTLLDCICH